MVFLLLNRGSTARAPGGRAWMLFNSQSYISLARVRRDLEPLLLRHRFFRCLMIKFQKRAQLGITDLLHRRFCTTRRPVRGRSTGGPSRSRNAFKIYRTVEGETPTVLAMDLMAGRGSRRSRAKTSARCLSWSALEHCLMKKSTLQDAARDKGHQTIRISPCLPHLCVTPGGLSALFCFFFHGGRTDMAQ